MLGWKKTSIVSIAPRRIAIPPFVRSCTWVLGRARGGAATAARTKRNSKTERRRSKTRRAHTNHQCQCERPRPPSKEPIGILYIILFRFAFSRAVSGLQATEGLSRGSLALGELTRRTRSRSHERNAGGRRPRHSGDSPLTSLVRIHNNRGGAQRRGHTAESARQSAHAGADAAWKRAHYARQMDFHPHPTRR